MQLFRMMAGSSLLSLCAFFFLNGESNSAPLGTAEYRNWESLKRNADCLLGLNEKQVIALFPTGFASKFANSSSAKKTLISMTYRLEKIAPETVTLEITFKNAVVSEYTVKKDRLTSF